MRTLAKAADMTGVEGRVEPQVENSPPGHEVIGERPQEDVSAAEGPPESGEGESNSGQRGRVKSPVAGACVSDPTQEFQ